MWEITGNKIKNLKKEFASTLLPNVPYDVRQNTFSHTSRQNCRHVSRLFPPSPSDQFCKMKIYMQHDTLNNPDRGLAKYVEINK